MRVSKVISLIFAASATLLVLLSFRVCAAENWHWGEQVDGLQLGVFLDSSNRVLRCQVRNATNEDVAYNDYYFGLRGCLTLEMRDGTNWIELKSVGLAVIPGMGIESCAGPIGKRRILQPGQVLTETQQREQTYTGSSERNQWLVKSSQHDTFLIDLAGSRWPKDIDIVTHEFRIGQRFGSADKKFSPLTTAYSPSFSISAAAIQPVKTPKFRDALDCAGQQ